MEKGGMDPESARSPLLSNERREKGVVGEGHHWETYSVKAAILPFFFPALGGLLYGYDIGATSGATISIQSVTLSGTTWYNLSAIDIGLQVSGSLYGALIGSVLAYTVSDFLGRRRELIISALLFLIGALLTAFAPYFPVMVIGRFIYGIGIGLAMHAAPMYIAETGPSQIRGILISLKEFFIVFGMLLGYITSSVFVDIVGGWRYMYGSSSFVSLIMIVGMWWLPSSPRWVLLCALQGQGSMHDARESAIFCYCNLRGRPTDSSATVEIDIIIDELSYAGQHRQGSFKEVFQGKSMKALKIGAGLVFFQQITGQPSVLYYAATILQSAGFSAASDATQVSILLGLLKLIMTGVAVLAVDRLGRRPLLLGGVSGITLALFLLASYYTLLKDSSFVAVIALLLYVGSYQLSFGPIGWLMISEIFPLRLRGRGLSIAVFINFATNALVTFAFSPLETLLGTGALFGAFGVIAILSLVFIFFVVPETRGLSLEEIESKIL